MSEKVRILTAGSLALLLLVIGDVRASERSPQSNGAIMLRLCGEAVTRFVSDARLPETTEVVLKMNDGEMNHFFTQTLVEIFHRNFSALFLGGVPQDVEVSASVEDVTVSYGDPFSDGFFSPRKCQRNLDLRLTLTAKRCRDGKILWAGDEPASLTDTVNVADVPLLEQSTEHIAKGIHPQRSILERLIEPFIIVGATGVAIYLFFTIRS